MNALDLTFRSRDLNKTVTIRDYLKELLTALWEEQEGFNGKRPFGNSGWTYEVYECLVVNKIISGTVDVHGYIETFDKKEAHDFMIELIQELK